MGLLGAITTGGLAGYEHTSYPRSEAQAFAEAAKKLYEAAEALHLKVRVQCEWPMDGGEWHTFNDPLLTALTPPKEQ